MCVADDRYLLEEVFNFGRTQGNALERSQLGTWIKGEGRHCFFNK
jgi:hypothetical protein